MDIIWEPTEAVRNNSVVGRFMQKHGLASFEELYARSVEDMQWFWNRVERELGIVWRKPYTRVYDDSEGFPWTKWFVGGELNVVETCVAKWAKVSPEKIALLYESEAGNVRKMSYGELWAKVNSFAAALLALGIREGDRVGIYLPMVPETVVAMFALAQIGAIFLPIFSGFSAPAVATRLKDAEAVACIYADGFTRRGKLFAAGKEARKAMAMSPSVRHRLCLPLVGEPLDSLEQDIRPWLERGEKAPVAQLSSEAPLFIAYTSGTTGKPKGAVHVHGGFLVKIAEEVAFQTDCHAEDTLFWVTDMGWIMGPWEVFGGLANGATVFLYDGVPMHPTPDRLFALAARHRVSILGVSPTLVRALIPHGDEALLKHDLSSLRIFGSTGEPWNRDPYLWLFEKVGEKRCPIINLSGGTEVGACFLSPHPVQKLKPCSLGGPALGMDVDVVNERGEPVRGEVGELVCRKPWPGMTRGIYKDPERFLKTYFSRFPNLWVHGDWASIDGDGFIFLHGRSDDTLNVAGKRLGPEEVETVLVANDQVKEAAAVGLPDKVKGESVGCFVVLRRPLQEAELEKLRKDLAEQVVAALGKAFAPKKVVFVSDLPKTRSAKIVRRAVKAVALGKELGDLSSLENPQVLDDIARSLKG